MGGKHLKRLRAEKSKVQLKKKKLPKGQNLTDTTFMVKKILPIEQLQKIDKDEPVSNWNVPLKDLLVRLNHYNFTSRLNSLFGIKELVTKYPEILKGPLLKPLISRLLELLTDEEHKIRVTAIDLISYLFDFISPLSITAFEKILVVYLGCAMTHRNASIQQDSLKLIDVIINYSPEAIKCNFKQIAQNLIRILKSCFYESYAGVFSLGKSKQDLEKTKREMLFRFYQFINIGYPKITETKQSSYRNYTMNVSIGQKRSFRNLCNKYKKIPDLSVFKSSENREIILSDFDSSEFMSFCSLIIPLLFDTWTEFSPHQGSDDSSECVLTESVAELLSILLKILLFLYERAVASQDAEVENWFISNYGPAFKKFFMLKFPYLPSISTRMSKVSNSSGFAKGFNAYMMQNLMICYLAYSFKAVDKKRNLEAKIESYVSGALLTNQQEIEILLKVIRAAIQSSKYKTSNVILCNVIEAYIATSNSEFRQSLSKVLMNIALEENGSLGHKDEGIMNWMKSLPHRLCESQVFVEELETILKLITTASGAEVLKEVELKAEEIMENLQIIKIEGITHLEGQKMIADILYRCSGKVLMVIMRKIILGTGMFSQDLKNYILDIFSQKLSGQSEFHEVMDFH